MTRGRRKVKMSISYQVPGGWMVNHDKFIAAVYRQVYLEDCTISGDFTLLPGLFLINHPFKLKMERKRKLSVETGQNELSEEIVLVKNTFQKFLVDAQDLSQEQYKSSNLPKDNDAKELSKKIFEITNFDFGTLQGGNNSTIPLKCRINNEFYLIPPLSRFICGDVVQQVGKLNGSKFDLVVVDPPWWNKYIRRLKVANASLSYSMMYNQDIASIPLAPCLADSCLVAVWCTNSPSNIKAVKEVIFPSWGITYAATWYWMKVTKCMEPICSFGSPNMKQPYERIMLGTVGTAQRIPNGRLIVSVPSALHSHKPPLAEVLSQYMEESSPRSLELFARYMMPNTTSVGYEPLKWQHISLYKQICDDVT